MIKMARYNGTNGADRIAGTSKADFVLSAHGNDLIVTGMGNDTVFSGGGRDTVQAGDNDDLLSGGAGRDLISGGNGNDIIVASGGNDIIGGDAGDDILSGGAGSDVFQFKANAGNDIITDFQFGKDVLNIYAGTFGNEKNIAVSSFWEIQKFIAHYGLSVTDEGQDAVKIHLDANQSITLLNAGTKFGFAPATPNDAGTSADDLIFGASQNGHLVGGTGNDTILSGANGSFVEGTAGNDVLIGGARNDIIGGQEGDDFLFGNAGNDILSGGAGNDVLTGGGGADTFQFKADFGHDTITDLHFNQGDRVVFYAGAVSAGNVVIDSLSDLKVFALEADVTHVEGANLVVSYGANSVTFVGMGDLVF